MLLWFNDMMMIWDSILILKEMISLKSISSLVKVPNRCTHNHNTNQMTCTQWTKSHTTQTKIPKVLMTMSKAMPRHQWTLRNLLATNKLAQPNWHWSLSPTPPELTHLLTRKTNVTTCSSHAATGKHTERLRRHTIFSSSAPKSSSGKTQATSMIPMNNLALKTPRVQLTLLKLKDAREKPS